VMIFHFSFLFAYKYLIPAKLHTRNDCNRDDSIADSFIGFCRSSIFQVHTSHSTKNVKDSVCRVGEEGDCLWCSCLSKGAHHPHGRFVWSQDNRWWRSTSMKHDIHRHRSIRGAEKLKNSIPALRRPLQFLFFCTQPYKP
jgi:hypothetical protein